MVTVKSQLESYCIEQHIPPPSKNDLEQTGRMVAYHFKRFWCNKFPDGIIENAGFLKQTEDGKDYIVFFYPEEYIHAMNHTFNIFYSKKGSPITRPSEPKKARTRIPTPAFTGKKLIKSNG